jgi:hypothetical protein
MKFAVFSQALQLARLPIILAFFVTPCRFLLELAGLPEFSIFLIGLLWLTLAFAIFWGVKLFDSNQPYQILLLALAIYSPISRLTVFAAWWVDRKWELDTHYGLYFDTWEQALFNQVVYGAGIQIIPGFILGAFTVAMMRRKKGTASKRQASCVANPDSDTP